MTTVAEIRARILGTTLKEEAVNLPDWGDNLIIRELSAKAGSALIAQCTNKDGTQDQDLLVSGVILATLRNADEPTKPLVFGLDDKDEPNPVYRDALMETGLQTIMAVAKESLKFSGLDESAQVAVAKNASSETSGAASPTTSQAA